MADARKVLEYAEEKLSRLHPDERDKPHIGMMVESGFLKETVELLKEQKPEKAKKAVEEYGFRTDIAENIIKEFESQVKSFAPACTSDDLFKECCEAVLELLKEQEADIIAMSRFLESHGWDSDSICGKLS